MAKLVRIANRDAEVSTHTVDRAGGAPIGMTAETWPRYEGAPMHHVLTLGRDNIVGELPAEVAAVAVFINAPMNNEAYTPNTKETAVVFLSEADLARGTTSAEEVFGAALEGDGIGSGVLVSEVVEYTFEDVAVFDDEEDRAPEAELDEDDVNMVLGEFFEEQVEAEIGDDEVMGLSATHTMWLQSPECPEGYHVLFQFYDELVEGLNCGGGQMYVATNGVDAIAWWQC